MEQPAAIKLINHPRLDNSAPSQWADLGCGRGTFTKALADLLGEGSHILAVDENLAALRSLPSVYKGVHIEARRANFISDDWPAQLDGVLMANSLHFISDQTAFLLKLKQHLKRGGKLILVEYDTEQSNPWVPYPHSLAAWREIFLAAGFTHFSEIGRRPSAYGRAEIVGIWIE